jgi:HlyD family secretion protein
MPGGVFAAGRRTLLSGLLALAVSLAAHPYAQHRTPGAPTATIILHGLVEPVRSYTVTAPRLAASGPGAGPGPLIIIHLAPNGTFVKRGDVLVEFDRHAQLDAVRDRDAEFRQAVEELAKRRSEHRAAEALRRSELRRAENDRRKAALDVEAATAGEAAAIIPRITAEKNALALAEAEAHLDRLRATVDLRRGAEEAELRILEIQRDRALGALEHARRNAERMRVAAPHDGLVVLKSLFRAGTMTDVQEGEEVRAGVPILEVVDPSAMRVRASVNQADVAGLTAGLPAKITLDSQPDRSFRARLTHLSPVATTSALSPRVRTFVALFDVEGTDDRLLPDLAAAIEIAPNAPGAGPAAGGGDSR